VESLIRRCGFFKRVVTFVLFHHSRNAYRMRVWSPLLTLKIKGVSKCVSDYLRLSLH
jgi:hypothetical protein